jgi:long-subunit acyl-CoA synthetase (AMP-forming)
MAHAGGRLTAHYMALPYGSAITACPDMRELAAYLPEVRPDALFSVPRVWEKFQVAIEAMIEGQDEEAKVALKEALARGREAARDGRAPDPRDVELFKPIVARLGLDRIKAAFVGGAPSAPELSEFFRAVGVPLLEAYGLTEGSLNVFNRVEDFKGGTAGKPLPTVELKLADDGEILVRAPLNMVGYRKDPEQTAQALDADGWLHTGDIGEVDDEGWVKIVDRKKEIIISAAGKNMSPANIESAIKGESSLIGQIVTIGEGKRYNTALVTLDPEAASMYAKRLGMEDASIADLADAPEIVAEIQAAVDRGNERLSRVEQIKKFKLLPAAWVPDTEELTPTMKLKRKPIAAKYAQEIEALYAE